MNSQPIADDSERGRPESIADAIATAEPERKSFKERMKEFERQIIAEALEETGGRVTRAARILGLTHQGLCYLIQHRHTELKSMRRPIQIRRKSIMSRDHMDGTSAAPGRK